MVEIEKVVPIKMNSLQDLVRLAATISSPQSMMYILKFKNSNGNVVLGVLGIFRDYYKYYGVPIFYYYVVGGDDAEKVMNSNYIVISISDEKIEFTKHPKPGSSIPMITLAEKPPFLPDLD